MDYLDQWILTINVHHIYYIHTNNRIQTKTKETSFVCMCICCLLWFQSIVSCGCCGVSSPFTKFLALTMKWTNAIIVYGTLCAFNPKEEDWPEYAVFFMVNGITTDANKHTILLSNVGPSTFHLMRSLVLPNTLDSCSFDDLVTKVRDHKELPPSVIVRHDSFWWH